MATHLKIIPQVNILRKKYSFYFKVIYVHLRKIRKCR